MGTDSPKIKFVKEMLELNPDKKYVILQVWTNYARIKNIFKQNKLNILKLMVP